MADDWSKFPVAEASKTDEWAAFPAANSKPKEDPIKAEVRKELADLRKAGVPIENGRPRQFLQGATFGFADEALAGLTTPLEMIKRGTLNPSKGYNYAKAREDILLEDARKAGGISGQVMEAAGGFGTGLGLASKGLTFMRPGASALANIPRAAADGAVFGGLTGFGEGSGAQGRLEGAATGGGVGLAAGGVVGAAAPVVSALGRNALGWVSATRDPVGYAQRQVARGLAESGRMPQQIAQEIADANAIGQPFTVADAMGNSGQRLLSTIARAPGRGRTMATEFLDARQADQGRRLSNIIAEGLDAPQSAALARQAMTEQRTRDAAANYGAARGSAGAVNVTPAIREADNFLQPGVTPMLNPGSNIADDSIEAAVRRARSYLTDGRGQISDFDQALRAKQELDNMIERASGAVQRQLIPVRNALDNALASSSQPYANARNTFRAQSQAINAVDTGNMAARRGRTEDTLRAFGGMAPESQQGFRIGYADKLIEDVQGGAMGQNKARPFSSLSSQSEIPALSRLQGPSRPGDQDQLMRRIGRENTMFETRATATGGSKTADNLADAQGMGVNPEVIGNALSGNYMAAIRNLVGRSSGALSGYTPRVREELARILLAGNGPQLQSYIQQITSSKQQRDALLRALASGFLGGGNVTATGLQRKN